MKQITQTFLEGESPTLSLYLTGIILGHRWRRIYLYEKINTGIQSLFSISI